MPLSVFGTFEVRASRDLGSLGPKEGEPVELSFPLYRHLSRLLPWLFFLPLFLVKGNRTPKALLILIPVAIVQTLLIGLGALLSGFIGSEGSLLFTSLTALNLGLASCWLLLHRIGGRNRAITCLLALLILAVFGLAGLFSHGSFDYMLAPLAIVYGFMMSAVLLSILLAAVFCRKRYRAGRFIWFLVLASLVVAVFQLLPFVIFAMIAYGAMGSGGELLEILAAFGISAGMASGLMFGLHLPYLILAFGSAFYRERFFGALRLKGMAQEEGEGPADPKGPEEWSEHLAQ